VHLLLALVKIARRDSAVLEKIGVPTDGWKRSAPDRGETASGCGICKPAGAEPRVEQDAGAGFPRGGELQGRVRFDGASLVGVAHVKGDAAREALAAAGATHDAILKALTAVAAPARHRPESEGKFQALENTPRI